VGCDQSKRNGITTEKIQTKHKENILEVKYFHLGSNFPKVCWDLTFLWISASRLHLSSQTAVRQAGAVIPSGRVSRSLLDTTAELPRAIAAGRGWICSPTSL